MYIKENAVCPQGFTVVPNDLLRDKRLHLRACGLYVRMLSLPPTWDFSVRGLAAICREGHNTLSTCLGELEQTGYLRRTRQQNSRGQFSGYRYEFLAGHRQTCFPVPVSVPQLNKERKQTKKQPVPRPQTRYSVWADDPEVY